MTTKLSDILLPYLPTERSDLKALYTIGQNPPINLCERNVPAHAKLQANSVACLVKKKYLHEDDKSYRFTDVPTLGDSLRPSGSSANFKEELAPGFGTAFLVGNGLALTAGHCIFKNSSYSIDKGQIKTTVLVFGSYLQKQRVGRKYQVTSPIDKSRVCKIKAIVYVSKNAKEGDWALLKLDKNPAGIAPLPIDFTNVIHTDISIYMLGHPYGTPLKYTHKGLIVSKTPEHEPQFETAIDVFAGNSGSPIFNAATHQVIGILIADNTDVDDETRKHCASLAQAQQFGYERCQRMSTLPDTVVDILDPDQSRLRKKIVSECTEAERFLQEDRPAEAIKILEPLAEQEVPIALCAMTALIHNASKIEKYKRNILSNGFFTEQMLRTIVQSIQAYHLAMTTVRGAQATGPLHVAVDANTSGRASVDRARPERKSRINVRSASDSKARDDAAVAQDESAISMKASSKAKRRKQEDIYEKKEIDSLSCESGDVETSLKNIRLRSVNALKQSPLKAKRVRHFIPTRSKEVIKKRIKHLDESCTTIKMSCNVSSCKSDKIPLKVNNVLERLSNFTGRQAELDKLAQSFVPTASRSIKQTIVRLIYGPDGIGKTELTRAFAQDHEEDYAFIWFINCATDTQKNQNYRALAKVLELSILDDEAPEQVETKVYNFLEYHSYEKPWLIIYGNVEQAFKLPKGGCVLMTSRTKNVWKINKECIPLAKFSEHESVELLSKITGQNSSHLPKLAQELGYFPLALYQAASYIQRDKCTIDGYLKVLKKSSAHDKMFPDEKRDQDTVQTVWQITLQKLEQNNPKAYAWFKICAFLNPDEIPQEWVTDWLKKQPRRAGDCNKTQIFKALEDLSLIGKRGNGYSIHRLLQQVTRQSQNEKEGFKQAWKVVIDNYPKKERFENWRQAETWIAQAKSIEGHHDFQTFSEEEQANMLDMIGSSLRDLGRYMEALKYRQKALGTWEKVFLLYSPDLAKKYNNIAVNLRDLGLFKDALEHNQKALKVLEEALPPGHPDLAMSYNNVGIGLRDLGRYTEALEHKQIALDIWKKALPPDHPDLARSYNNIGSSLSDLGQHTEALEHAQKALQIKKKILPLNHPDLFRGYDNVSFCLNALGQPTKALEYAQIALKMREEVLPPDHPDLAMSYDAMSLSLNRLGRHAEALDYAQKALQVNRKVFLVDHPTLADNYDNMGFSLNSLGKYTEALEYRKKSLQIRKKMLPSNHPNLATSYENVSLSLLRLGWCTEALEHAEEALQIREKVLPKDHPDLAMSYGNIGLSLRGLGRYKEALGHAQIALKIREEKLPHENPDLATSYENMGLILRDLGKHTEALEHVQKALKIREKVLPSDHPDLATNYENVGLSLRDLGRHKEALEHVRKALRIREKVFHQDHPDLATSYENIGLILKHLRRHTEALKYVQKALEIREKVLPQDHPDLATSHENMGFSLSSLEQYTGALEHSQKALKIRKKMLPSNHPDLATSYENVGSSLGGLGQPMEALKRNQNTYLPLQYRNIDPKIVWDERNNKANEKNPKSEESERVILKTNDLKACTSLISPTSAVQVSVPKNEWILTAAVAKDQLDNLSRQPFVLSLEKGRKVSPVWETTTF